MKKLELNAYKEFNEEEGEIQGSPVVANVIIPPKRAITVQSVIISNMTDEELEVWVRIENQIREIAVDKLPEM